MSSQSSKAQSKVLNPTTRFQYEQVREVLLRNLSQMNDGDRLPAERELSTRLQVDRAAIRRAMRDLSEEGFVVRHHGRGTFVRKPSSQVTASTPSTAVAFSVPGIEIPIHRRFIDAIEQEVERHGRTLVIYNARCDTQREWQHLRQLSTQDISDIIVTPFEDDSLRSEYIALINDLKKAGKRVVLFDQYIPQLDVPVAMSNRQMIGYRATEHLIMLGHKRIAYATSGHYDTAGTACYAGYKQALVDYGLEFHEELVIERPLAFCAKPVRDAVIEMLHAKPRAFTAIATEHFSMTFGIIKAMKQLGLTPDQDIGVVGAELFQNPSLLYLTHTAQQIEEMGQSAVKLLLDPPSGTMPKSLLLEPNLVIGQPKESLPTAEELMLGPQDDEPT